MRVLPERLDKADCLQLKILFQSPGFVTFRRTLLRSRLQVLAVLEDAKDLREIYRAQGKTEQLRALDRLPNEIQALLDQFKQEEEQELDLEQEKERHGKSLV